ncbi:hypothetical protein [Acetobacter papayae]|nr:hypothetical protein [Acetobacter papayae]
MIQRAPLPPEQQDTDGNTPPDLHCEQEGCAVGSGTCPPCWGWC